MNLDRYIFEVSPDHSEYEFYSHGPKGRIKKFARFDPFETDDGQRLINLAFGDWNEQTRSIDDEIASNNGDADKILATVAFIVLDFTNRYPGTVIYAGGSTGARTRKYQMSISRYYEDISNLFHVFGITKDNNIQHFTKNINYVGFLVRRKFP